MPYVTRTDGHDSIKYLLKIYLRTYYIIFIRQLFISFPMLKSNRSRKGKKQFNAFRNNNNQTLIETNIYTRTLLLSIIDMKSGSVKNALKL